MRKFQSISAKYRKKGKQFGEIGIQHIEKTLRTRNIFISTKILVATFAKEK